MANHHKNIGNIPISSHMSHDEMDAHFRKRLEAVHVILTTDDGTNGVNYSQLRAQINFVLECKTTCPDTFESEGDLKLIIYGLIVYKLFLWIDSTKVTDISIIQSVFQMFSRLFHKANEDCLENPSKKENKRVRVCKNLMVECVIAQLKQLDPEIFVKYLFMEKSQQHITMFLFDSISLALSRQSTNTINMLSNFYLKMFNLSFEEFDYQQVVQCDNPAFQNIKYITKFTAFALPKYLSNVWRMLNKFINDDFNKMKSDLIIANLKFLNILLQIVAHEEMTFDETEDEEEEEEEESTKQLSEEERIRAFLEKYQDLSIIKLNDFGKKDNSQNPHKFDKKSTMLKIKLDQKWFDENFKFVKKVLSDIIDSLFVHPDKNVRLNLFKFTLSLLSYCAVEFISNSFLTLFWSPMEYLSKMKNDSIFMKNDNIQIDNQIQEMCGPKLEGIFQRKFKSNKSINVFKMKNLLHEQAFILIIDIPNQFRNLDSGDKNVDKNISIISKHSSSLNFINGFISLLNIDGLYDFLKLEQHKYHLFRTLINLGEFDFKQSKPWIEFDKDEFNFDLIATTDKKNYKEFILQLYEMFHFEKYFRFLNDKKLLANYLTLICQLSQYSRFKTFQLMINHLSELLEYSDFEPTVVLVINTLLTSIDHLDHNETLENCLKDLRNSYLKKLAINEIYAVEADLANYQDNNDNEKDKSSFLKLNDIFTICSSSSSSIDSLKESRSKETKLSKAKQTLRRKLIQHCLLIKGLTLLYSLSDRDKIHKEFFEKFFMQLVMSISFNEHHQMVSDVAKICLIFIGQHLDPSLYNNKETIHSKFFVHEMIISNLDYIYSSFSIILDSSVHHSQMSSTMKDLFNLYEYDFYSINNIQCSLLAIINMMCEYHKTIVPLNDGPQIGYLNRLIDHTINLIKYYSIKSLEIDPDDLNRLLEVLFAYEDLITLVYDGQKYVPSINQRIKSTNDENTLDEMIQKLENLLKGKQEEVPFVEDGGEETEELNDQEFEESESNKEAVQKILQSPIINSRIGNILHLCPMILADPNIQIRLNVLHIAYNSMALLRSYEDILLPYVHRLWDPLVQRFSMDLEHPQVVKRAFDCLLLASELCGDFILRRTRNEVLPSLIKFLQDSFEKRISYHRKYHKMDTIKSIEYHAEFELLQSLGQLVVNLKLSSQDLWKLIPTLLLYICAKGIMEELQRCSLESLITIASQRDPYSVRYFVHQFLVLFFNNDQKDVGIPNIHGKLVCDCSRKLDQIPDVIRRYSESFKPYEKNLIKDLISYFNENIKN